MRKIAFLLGGMMISTPAFASGGGGLDGCAALLAPVQIDYNHSLAETYAYSQAQQYNSSHNQNGSIGVTIPIYGVPVNLTGSEASSSVTSQLSNTNLNWSIDARTGYLLTYVPTTAGDQFNQCVRDTEGAKDAKLTISATPDENGGAVFTVDVHETPQGYGVLPRRVYIETNGTSSTKYNRWIGQRGGPISVDVARPDPGGDLKFHVVLSTFSGGPIDDEWLTLPPIPKETSYPISSSLDPVRCGGGNFGRQYAQTPVEVDAKPGEVLYPDKAQIGLQVGMPATGGNHPDKFKHGAAEDGGQAGFEFTYASPDKIIGHSWCTVAANENPGDSIGFVVYARKIVVPDHVGPPMQTHPLGARL